jgi:hypothetical protein
LRSEKQLRARKKKVIGKPVAFLLLPVRKGIEEELCASVPLHTEACIGILVANISIKISLHVVGRGLSLRPKVLIINRRQWTKKS